jgi:hypothetical protein
MVHSPDMNRYCLVSKERAALELACRFSIDKPEPGPYCVVDVWRSTVRPGHAAPGTRSACDNGNREKDERGERIPKLN